MLLRRSDSETQTVFISMVYLLCTEGENKGKSIIDLSFWLVHNLSVRLLYQQKKRSGF